VHGPPDYFVTFTCNSKWPEISESLLEPGQKPTDRPDIIVRVYHMKLEELLNDIKSEKWSLHSRYDILSATNSV
jgi:hypothetical protein